MRFDELPVLKCSDEALYGLRCSRYFWSISSYLAEMPGKLHDGEVGAIYAILDRDVDGKVYGDSFVMHFIARVVLDKKED